MVGRCRLLYDSCCLQRHDSVCTYTTCSATVGRQFPREGSWRISRLSLRARPVIIDLGYVPHPPFRIYRVQGEYTKEDWVHLHSAAQMRNYSLFGITTAVQQRGNYAATAECDVVVSHWQAGQGRPRSACLLPLGNRVLRAPTRWSDGDKWTGHEYDAGARQAPAAGGCHLIDLGQRGPPHLRGRGRVGHRIASLRYVVPTCLCVY